MEIKKMVLGNLENNTYIVIGDSKKTAVIVDPSYEPERIVEYLGNLGLTLKAILVTHGHFDHVAAIPKIIKHIKVPVITHIEEAEVMKDSMKNLSTYFMAREIIASADTYIEDNEEIDLGDGLIFKAIIVPGHSPKSVCYYNQKSNVLFSGDTLMPGAMGRTDFYAGSSGDLQHNIKERLMFLPKETVVYCGHGIDTTIGREQLNNPYIGNKI